MPTTAHASLEAARKAQGALAEAAEKHGWKRKEARAGFAARPDAFDAAHLPKPGKK